MPQDAMPLIRISRCSISAVRRRIDDGLCRDREQTENPGASNASVITSEIS